MNEYTRREPPLRSLNSRGQRAKLSSKTNHGQTPDAKSARTLMDMPTKNDKTVIRKAVEIEAKLEKSNKADGIGDAHHLAPEPRNRRPYDFPGTDWSYWFFIGRRSNTFRTIHRGVAVSRMAANRSRSPARRLYSESTSLSRDENTSSYPAVGTAATRPPAAKPSHDIVANDNDTRTTLTHGRTVNQPASQDHRQARRRALIRLDAWGNLLNSEAPETVRCAVCRGTTERLSSAWQDEGIAYHNYQCRTERCPAAGTIVDHESGDERRVGPVFDDRDLAVRLATRDHPDAPAESREVAP